MVVQFLTSVESVIHYESILTLNQSVILWYNPSMPYDNTCKFIAEQFSADIASWLLGQSVVLSRLEPSELSLEPIRADALILLQSKDLVLHCEF
jgi:hypothetical protein